MPNRVRSDSPTSSSNAQTSVAQPASERVDPKLLLAIVATGLMTFIGILTETMTNVLFPTLMEEFHIGTAMVQWLTTGYLLVVSIVTPLSSYLNHRFTLKTSFIAAVVLCIAGLLLAALAANFPMLMIARILQGAGTGVALPLMFNIILEQSPRSRLGLLMGVGNMVCAIAPALGPTVGGVGVAAIGWRWMFGVLVLFLAVAGIVGIVTIRQPHATQRVRFHWAQLMLLMLGLVTFVFALDRFGAAITALTAHAQNAAGTLVLAIVLMVSVGACVVRLREQTLRRPAHPHGCAPRPVWADAPDSVHDGAGYCRHSADAASDAPLGECVDDLRGLHRVHGWLLDGLPEHDDSRHERDSREHAARWQRHVQHVPTACRSRRHHSHVDLPGRGASRAQHHGGQGRIRGGHAAWWPCGLHCAAGCVPRRVLGEYPRIRRAPNGVTTRFFFT